MLTCRVYPPPEILPVVVKVQLRHFSLSRCGNNAIGAHAGETVLTCKVILIFVALELPENGESLNWWGNNVFTRTADFLKTPLLPVPEGGIRESQPI